MRFSGRIVLRALATVTATGLVVGTAATAQARTVDDSTLTPHTHFVVQPLNPDGTISVNDRSFTSPSGASDHVTGGSTNGWDFWGTTHDDTTTTLSQFRDEAIKRLEGHEN